MPQQKSVNALLASSHLFAPLTEDQRAALADICHIVPRFRGEVIFVEGEEAAGLHIVVKGKVKISRIAPDGREAVLHVFGAGELFGEVAVFQGSRFPATAECVEAGASLFLPRREFLLNIERDPALAFSLLAAMSLRLRAFAAKVESLTLKGIPQRLAAYFLLALREREAQGGEKRGELRLDISKALLAGVLGTARETLSRCLGRMAEQGILSVDGRKVRILDRGFLEDLAKGAKNL